MILAHQISPNKINSNFNTREEILKSTGPISFDGVYKNVYENRDILKDRDVILFVMGDYVGKDNSFDIKQPLTEMCNWNEIMDLAINHGCKLGWHTWSHPDLTTLSLDEVVKECTPPFKMDYFAYPHGRYNDMIKNIIEDLNYKNAWSVTQGDNTPFALCRHYL